MNLAIIPARGGSKRIPQKNIKSFNGSPIISYSIRSALASDAISDVYVSTDDQEIERIAIEHGAKSLGLRCAALSDDYSSSTDVVRYEIKRLQASGLEFEYVAEVYATAPMLEPVVIDAVYQQLRMGVDVSFAFAAVEFAYPVQRGFYIKEGRCSPVDPASFDQRSQDLRTVFHDAGQVYWASVESWLQEDIRFNQRALPIPVPQNTVCDIDSLDDWFIAEAMCQALSRLSE